jgi:hypothetical protein
MSLGRSHYLPLANGYEQDGLSDCKCFYFWKPGQRKYLKRSYNKRIRRHARFVIAEHLD